MKSVKIVLFLIGITIYSYGQSPYIGAKYGIGITKLTNKHITNNADSMRSIFSTGSNYSLYGGITFTDRIALQVELVYNSLNQKYQGDVLGGYQSITEIKTFDVPVMLQVGKWVYAEAGPVLNVLLKAEFKSLSDSLNSADVTDKFDKTTWGIAFGGGGRLNLGEHFALNLGVRAYIGIKDFGNGVDALGQDIHDYNTTGWSVGLNGGLRIRF
ncbi:MAG: outer membrane beta-barrel protein [Bacteroidia bacterium]|nr:outer membrane beta-barrel protein [Bacteroidia bacterium]